MMRSFKTPIYGIYLVAALLAYPAFSFGADVQDSHTLKLIEGAKKERALMWYTSTSIEDVKGLFNLFNKKYPFIKTEFVNAGSARLFNRILNEARAGKVYFDLVAVRGMETQMLVKDSFLQPYMSPESSAYPAGFKDPKGHWVDYFDAYNVIGFNTKQVPKEQAPKSWEDLLNSRWKGKIALDDGMYSWYGAMHLAWGRERAQNYMKALAKQDIQLRGGQTLIAQLMAAGEFPIGMVLAHRMERMKEQGGRRSIGLRPSIPSPSHYIRSASPPRRPIPTRQNCSSTLCFQRKDSRPCSPSAEPRRALVLTPKCSRKI